MADVFAVGKRAKAICDICGFTVKYTELKELVINEQPSNLRACRRCWNADHPQYQVGKLPVVDAEALRNPRPDQPDREIVNNPEVDIVFGVKWS